MEYLYHYTSLETLALILHNKTICFNNLLYVDDIEEAETDDMGKFGKNVYVSCWTKDKRESIPLWSMYTPNMHGVRIRMPEFPFKKYQYKKGELFLTEDIKTHINIGKIYNENKVQIVSTEPHLVEVEYTEEHDKLYPKIRMESCSGALKVALGESSIDDIGMDKIKVGYSFENLGRYKHKDWEFQHEWRYIIIATPMGMQEMNHLSGSAEIFKRIEDRALEPPYKSLFLDLSEDVFEDIEIVFGPRMSESEKIMAKALLKQYCPHASYRESLLKIK